MRKGKAVQILDKEREKLRSKNSIGQERGKIRPRAHWEAKLGWKKKR